MNIHFTDKDLFERLKQATIAKVVVGSHMYGTNNENSDTDYLYIYATSQNELNSFIQTNHQLQYNEDGIDHNFVSLHTFLKNIVNGDSTINFEVVQSDALYDTDLHWLKFHSKAFITYTVVKSYLGLCNRDIKFYYKEKNEYNIKKKLLHIIRGCLYADSLLNNNFDFKNLNQKLLEINIDISNNNLIKKYTHNVSNLRLILNEKFNNKTLGLAQHINVDDGIILTNRLITFCNSSIFKDKQKILKDFDLSMFINSYENWVNY